MAVSERDVRHIAELGRLALPAERVPSLVAELNGILRHMDVLAKTSTDGVDPVLGVGAGGMRLRADDGDPYHLGVARDTFAPEMRAGFFLVPRLASHAAGSAAPREEAVS